MAHWLVRRSQQLFWDFGRLASRPDGRTHARTVRASLTSDRLRSGLAIGNGTGKSAARGVSTVVKPSSRSQIPQPGRKDEAFASSPRAYSTTSTSPNEPGVTCKTTEHTPGHNIATLSVSNPAKLNIVNSALLTSFIEKCQDLQADPNLRAVVLTGAPTNPGKAPSFIGGADIKEMIQLSSSEEARAFIDRIHQACDALRAISVPVVASIDGFCLGAGMEIAAACDLRVATESSTFGMPEVKVGIPSVVEAAYLPGLIGMGRTRRLLYLAENIDGRTAERWGFVEEVVQGREALDGKVGKWVEELVGMGPKAIRSQKVLMKQWEDVGVREGIELGAKAYAEAYADGGKEPREFMGKFVGRKR